MAREEERDRVKRIGETERERDRIVICIIWGER
jgi:hypothetical protein